MKRIPIEPRPDWRTIVEGQGFHFHSPDGDPYWDESAYYHFSTAEVDTIERASYALNDLCLKAVDHVVTTGSFARFGLDDAQGNWIRQSWDRDNLTLYGRFDFAYDGITPPKLLEYNADTPTALLEAAVIQWYWLQDKFPGRDQFNSIHEKLIDFWKTMQPPVEGPMHFVSLSDHLEDFMTANYLRDTAEQAGLTSIYLPIDRIGWNAARKAFVDEDERLLRTVYKLYPWEWMLAEEFGQNLIQARIRWFEPPWKLLLSHKEILVVLWELFPECPYLLKADHQSWSTSHVKKPVGGREGANVTITVAGSVVKETDGDYADGPFIFQEYRPLPNFDGNYPVIGSWMVNGHACGMGIREDVSPITRNTSRFVPHLFGDG